MLESSPRHLFCFRTLWYFCFCKVISLIFSVRSFDYLIGLFVPKASAGAMRREVVKAESCKLPSCTVRSSSWRDCWWWWWWCWWWWWWRTKMTMTMMMKIVMIIDNDDGDVNCCHTDWLSSWRDWRWWWWTTLMMLMMMWWWWWWWCCKVLPHQSLIIKLKRLMWTWDWRITSMMLRQFKFDAAQFLF